MSSAAAVKQYEGEVKRDKIIFYCVISFIVVLHMALLIAGFFFLVYAEEQTGKLKRSQQAQLEVDIAATTGENAYDVNKQQRDMSQIKPLPDYIVDKVEIDELEELRP